MMALLVVATGVGGLSEIIKHQQTGLLDEMEDSAHSLRQLHYCRSSRNGRTDGTSSTDPCLRQV